MSKRRKNILRNEGEGIAMIAKTKPPNPTVKPHPLMVSLSNHVSPLRATWISVLRQAQD